MPQLGTALSVPPGGLIAWTLDPVGAGVILKGQETL